MDSGMRRLSQRLAHPITAVAADPTWRRLVVPLAIWICACISLRYVYYGSSKLVLGPNSSRLLHASSLFVSQIQVKDEAEKGLMLFGFSDRPQLRYEAVWNVTKTLFVPPLRRKGFFPSMWLNQGSKIRVRWNLAATETENPLVVLLRGEKNYKRWLRAREKAHVIDLLRLMHGSGEMNYTVEVDDNYYLGAINPYSRTLKATMNVEALSLVYDTSKAKSKCSTNNGLCRLSLLFLNTHYAVLTTPTDWTGDDSAWYVELSYAARLFTYIVIMGLLVVLVYLFLQYFDAVGPEAVAATEVISQQSETSPLVVPNQRLKKTRYGSDDDCESNICSTSAELYDGKVCVICYEKPLNCFFIPCGHCATCYSCAQRLEGGDMKPCPICRRPIHKVRRLIS